MVRESYHLTVLRSRNRTYLCVQQQIQWTCKAQNVNGRERESIFSLFVAVLAFILFFNVHMFSFACQNQNGAASLCVYMSYDYSVFWARLSNPTRFCRHFFHVLIQLSGGRTVEKRNEKILRRFQTNFRHRIPEHINFAPCKWFPAAFSRLFFSLSLYIRFITYLLLGARTWFFYTSKMAHISKSYARTFFLQWNHKNVCSFFPGEWK